MGKIKGKICCETKPVGFFWHLLSLSLICLTLGIACLSVFSLNPIPLPNNTTVVTKIQQCNVDCYLFLKIFGISCVCVAAAAAVPIVFDIIFIMEGFSASIYLYGCFFPLMLIGTIATGVNLLEHNCNYTDGVNGPILAMMRGTFGITIVLTIFTGLSVCSLMCAGSMFNDIE
jgi:hypothetical protein